MRRSVKSYSLYLEVIIIILSAIPGCNRDNSTVVRESKLSPGQLIEINKQLVTKDRERIQSYIARKELDMEETGSGLWFEVTNIGNGDTIREGSELSLKYKCYLLDGTLCYDSDQDGKLKVILGSTEIPSGLDEGLRLMRYGEKARFILPSHLGYGLMGDNKRIPARSVLVYEIEILQ